VTQRLEEKLAVRQRRQMRRWWVQWPWVWLHLLLMPMRWCAAVAYNLKTRRWELLLRCCLPLLLLVTAVGVGIRELQLKAATTVANNNTAVANTMTQSNVTSSLPMAANNTLRSLNSTTNLPGLQANLPVSAVQVVKVSICF
jgi:hypothetical protein